MIEKMLHLDLLCLDRDREATLDRLRELGVMHIAASRADGAQSQAARAGLSAAEKAVMLIRKCRGKDCRPVRLEAVPVEVVLQLGERLDQTEKAARAAEALVAQYAPWGDFDPELARKVLAAGVDLSQIAELPDPLPPKRLSILRADAERTYAAAAVLKRQLAECDDAAIVAQFPGLAERIDFADAEAAMAQQGAVAVLSGWVPARRLDEVRTAAHERGWGLLARPPLDDELPPTLIVPPRAFRAMRELFDGLGIAPAYREADVSVPFMAYFSLFFAMLVGDGAYGAIFLGVTLALRRRMSRSWFALMTVFSSATVVWGVLSNTWFGAAIPWLSQLPTVAWLADPSYHHMMLLCFTIGASHLTLARVWNGCCLWPDSTALAQFGWAGVVVFMYLVTNSIVGIFPGIPVWGFWLFGVSTVLVFGFSVKPSELKTRGAELGMLPLNIMSVLGDVISYVRLFAVGLASVKVAENFNAMAIGLFGGHAWWVDALMAVAMVVILLVGHTLNLAMAALSVLVHAVRLNTLEFSNHKGVSWSGYAYRPFSRRAADKAEQPAI